MTFDEALEEISSQSEECRRVIEQAKRLAVVMNKRDKLIATEEQADDDIIDTKAPFTQPPITCYGVHKTGKKTLEFTSDEFDLIRQYMKAIESISPEAAVLNAISLALDHAE